MSKLFNVWVPTGEMWCYEVEAENAEAAKDKLLDSIENGECDWGDYDDYFYADVTKADWEVEEIKED